MKEAQVLCPDGDSSSQAVGHYNGTVRRGCFKVMQDYLFELPRGAAAPHHLCMNITQSSRVHVCNLKAVTEYHFHYVNLA